MMTQAALNSTAVRLAARALAAWHLGGDVGSVTLGDDGECRCYLSKGVRARDAYFLQLVGPLAEAALCGSGDALVGLPRVAAVDAAVAAVRSWLKSPLVRKHIAAVADQLVERRVMSGIEIDLFLQGVS